VVAENLTSAASPERLSKALRECGALRGGHIREVVVESSRATLLSRIIRLRLVYDGAGSEAPSSLIFKTGLPERVNDSWIGGRQEVAFYTQVAAVMSECLVPRCFEAVWDSGTNKWHLLLEDLTDTHVIATAWPLPPTEEQCRTILHALARFHAAWWDHPHLGVSVGAWVDGEAMNQHLQKFADEFKTFADRLGDRLSRERRDLYERFMVAAPRLRARYVSHRNISVVHGDAHIWNFFVPRNGGDGVRLFDWDAWRIGVPSSDLAYMMALHWYPDRRRRWERPLLDHYHATLLAHGVRGYDRQALDDDYRLSALGQIMTPVWQSAIDLPPVIWWSHLERIMLAIDDLGCRELLA
jgi:hypothetical protein